MVRREGHDEFYSHHAQSLHMDPKDNAMTRYIGNIRLAKQSRNICISWKWVKKQKLSQTGKIFEITDGKEGRAR